MLINWFYKICSSSIFISDIIKYLINEGYITTSSVDESFLTTIGSEDEEQASCCLKGNDCKIFNAIDKCTDELGISIQALNQRFKHLTSQHIRLVG